MTSAGFLTEFPPVPTHEWEEVICKDLKGADYARKLIWETGEGFAAKPYYRSDDTLELEHVNSEPGAFPYIRGTRTAAGWKIREEVFAHDLEEANRAALSAVTSGADEIAFCGVRIENESDLGLLLGNLETVPLHFENVDESMIRLLGKHLTRRRRGAPTSTGRDPLSNPDFAEEIVTSSPAGLLPFTIHGDAFEESGANATEEIGFTLAAAIDFMAEMQRRGVAINRAANSITFSFAIGSNLFIQIAKFRAFRMLWAQVVESFGGDRDDAKAHIHARTSRWNKTIYDPHVNVLRATCEAIAAVIGGADSITVAPFDACYKAPNPASLQLARNTQLILKHEAQLARVVDPGGGSYFLEVMTDSIARISWERMQEVESAGSYRKAIELGTIARRLEASRAAKEAAVTSRRCILTGTNRYANAEEAALSRIDKPRVDPTRRGAQPYEELRLRSELHARQTGKTPRILLAEIGDLKMRTARSLFTGDVFACAGLATVKQQFSDATQIALCEADLVVLCSSDGEYLKHTTDLLADLKKMNRQTPVIIAGNPDSADELRNIGIADFVHLRSNPIEFLSRWQRELGIED